MLKPFFIGEELYFYPQYLTDEKGFATTFEEMEAKKKNYFGGWVGGLEQTHSPKYIFAGGPKYGRMKDGLEIGPLKIVWIL